MAAGAADNKNEDAADDDATGYVPGTEAAAYDDDKDDEETVA